MVKFFAWRLRALVVFLASMAMVAVKPEVTALSDDEPVDPGVVQPPPLQLAPVEKKKTKNNPCATQIRGRLGKLLNFQCTCARQAKGMALSCFKQFQGDVESLFQLVWRLRNLDKQDMDNEAGTIRFRRDFVETIGEQFEALVGHVGFFWGPKRLRAKQPPQQQHINQ